MSSAAMPVAQAGRTAVNLLLDWLDSDHTEARIYLANIYYDRQELEKALERGALQPDRVDPDDACGCGKHFVVFHAEDLEDQAVRRTASLPQLA